MGFIKATMVNNLRAKFFGAGNRFFIYQGDRDDPNYVSASYAASPRGGDKPDEYNYLGLYQTLMNNIYTQLQGYLDIMYDVSMSIFSSYGVPRNEDYVGNVVATSLPGTSNLALDRPIEDDASKIARMVKHGGNSIVGEFGNSSLHARYFEWGTGPVGKRNQGNISDVAKKLKGNITYRDTPWTYFNYTVGHFVKTEGMPPRPFVYPAFLRMKGALIASLDYICKHVNTKWQAGTFPDHRGARGVNEGKGGRHGI